MNKKFVYQVGNNKKLYYEARPAKIWFLVLIQLVL
jgi:hypothetical protein